MSGSGYYSYLGFRFSQNFFTFGGGQILDVDSLDILSTGSSHTSSTPSYAHLRSAPKEIR